MEWKQHLLDTFRFNDQANRKLLRQIAQLGDRDEAVKLFSHLVNSQYKWMARLVRDPRAPRMDWWQPGYPLEQLESEWERSLAPWLAYVEAHSDEELCAEVEFTGFDGGRWAASPKDIALQLNYHSIHHRAQIQTLIRRQGLEPDFVDYIGTRYRKLS